jgi:hypothetical protein
VGNFDEHTWGISVSAINSSVAILPANAEPDALSIFVAATIVSVTVNPLHQGSARQL